MKLLHSAVILCIVSTFTACTEENNPTQQYGNSMVNTYKNAQKFDNKLNAEQVRKSIQEYQAANGRYPASLEELTAFNGILLKSDDYDYDPASGNITVKQ